MSKKLLILIAYITFNVAFTNADCKYGKGLKDFDYKKFEGDWYNYVTNSKEVADGYTCGVDRFNATTNKLFVNGIIVSPRSKIVDQADLQDFSSNPFGVHFLGPLAQYSGKFIVLATDYTGYSVVEGCFSSEAEKSFVWISLRHKNFKEVEEDAAKQAAKNLGLKWKDFYSFCNLATNK